MKKAASCSGMAGNSTNLPDFDEDSTEIAVEKYLFYALHVHSLSLPITGCNVLRFPY